MGKFASQFFSLRGMYRFDSEDLVYSVTFGDMKSGPGEGGGGLLRISSGRDDRMGAKIKTRINPWTKFNP